MDVQVNLLAVALATLSSMVVGSVWYTPKVFGNMWMKLAGLNKKDLEKNGWMPILVAILTSAVTAFVLAHVAFLSNVYFGNSFFQDSVTTAVWLWLGFTAARFITHDAFEGRRKKLTLLNITHEFVTLVAMGAIIGAMGV